MKKPQNERVLKSLYRNKSNERDDSLVLEEEFQKMEDLEILETAVPSEFFSEVKVKEDSFSDAPNFWLERPILRFSS